VALNLESREGKLLVAVGAKLFLSGQSSLKDLDIRALKSNVENINGFLKTDFTAEELFQVTAKSIELAVEYQDEKFHAKIGKK
jgi:hypothetical protein